MRVQSKTMAAAVIIALQLAALQETAAPASFLVARPRPPRRDLPRPLTPLERMRVQLHALEAKPSSVSAGLPYRRGATLVNAAELPLEGLGFFTMRPERNTHYGTDDLIAGLIEVGAALEQEKPGAMPLAVGDISGPKGGRVALHVSHRSGRDADLLFFWTDPKGASRLTEDFVHFDAVGRARYMRKDIRFDTDRNWRLVRALLTNERIGPRVSRILVWGPLRQLLLDHARRAEKDKRLLAAARLALIPSREKDGLHNDHFHVRVACSAREQALGCRD